MHVELEQRLAHARSPQADVEAQRLRALARAALFGGDRRAKLDRYELGEEIGRGGLGVVYRAHDPQLHRDVALKVIRPDATGSVDGLAMLVREARAIAALSHPNVVAVYDAGRVGDEVWVAMELVEGETFDLWLQRGRDWPQLCAALQQAGAGLAHAHGAGIVHRDFKPGNVMVGTDGRVRVLDFGLAKYTPTTTIPSPVPHASLGITDGVAGTPAYMAPEQLLGEGTDERSDQFSFCVVAFEALHRRRPFTGGTVWELAAKLDRGVIEVPGGPSPAPAHVDAVLRRGLARDPSLRFPSMTALLTALQRPAARRRRLVVVPAVVLAAGLGLAWPRAEHGDPCPAEHAVAADVWTAKRADAGAAAFARTGVGYAGATWSSVAAAMDDYGDRWSRAYDEVCSAPERPGPEERTPHVRCLEHRLATLGALVELLERADAAFVARAPHAVADLPDIDACLSDERVTSTFPPPADADQLATFARIEELLVDAYAHRAAGRMEPAIAAAGEALEQAETVGSGMLAARALYQLGTASRGAGDFEGAAEHMTAAFWQAMGSHSDAVAIDAATLLVTLHGHDLGQIDAAHRWERQVRALLPRATDAARAEFMLELAVAQSDLMRQDPRAADEHLQRALVIAQERLPERARDGALHTNLAGVAEAEGRLEDAAEHHRIAIESSTALLGEGHPELANARANFGILLHLQGDEEGARRELRAGIAIATAAGMGEHPMVGMAHNNLGLILMQAGELEEAQPEFDAALRTVEQAMPAGHPYGAFVRGNLGLLAAKRADGDAAREHLRRALVIISESMGPGDPMAARLTAAWGDVEERDGNDDLAIELYERALELVDGVVGQGKTRAQARFGLARLLWRAGTQDGARRHARTALEELRDLARSGPELEELRHVEAWLAAH